MTRLAPTISVLWTRRVIESASAAGVTAPVLWGLAGLDPDALDVHGRVRDSKHISVWDAVMRSGMPDAFPLTVARSMTLDDYGVLALASKTAATVGDALEVIARFLRMHTDAVTLSCERDADVVRAVIRRRGRRSAGMRAAIESAVAELWLALDAIASGPLLLRGAHFAHPAPRSTRPYLELFGRVTFASWFDGFELDAASTFVPATLADEGLHRHLRNELRAQAMPSPFDDVDRVARTVTAKIAAGAAYRLDLGQVARELGLTPRTLQRRLAAANTSFSSVVDAERKRAAKNLLEHPSRSVAEVAFVLGFSEVAAFHRAFRRWYRTTPARWRSRRRR